MNRIKFTLLFGYLFLLISCKQETTKKVDYIKAKTSISFAKGFDILTENEITKLIIKSPYPKAEKAFEYTIWEKDPKATRFDVLQNEILVPIKKIVVTSTTHIPILELLGEENSLIGFPHSKYISSEKTRALIEAGKIRELGKEASLNTEVLLDIKPELVVGFSMGKSNKTFTTIKNAGIPVILNGDWLEETPLGRAEWIKFFGILFSKEKQADSIFNNIKTNYFAAKEIAKKATRKSSILSGAIMSKDIWNLPAGESFVAQFLTDANTNYLWKDSKGKGSLSISFESILDRGKDADIWIAPGYFSSKMQMLNNNANYSAFSAFKKDKMFTFSNKVGETGGVIYFELGPTRPDLVLKDIIKIAHPSLLKEYQPTFFEKMN